MNTADAVTPVVLQHAGVVTDGDQYVQSTATSDIALLDSLPKEQQELAVTMMLDQGRQWLVRALEATNPARDVADFKAFVATVAEAAKQKKLSEDIQMDAVEMVRRSERALGVAIRKGQEAGEITTKGNRENYGGPHHRQSLDKTLSSPTDFLPHGNDRMATYTMTDDVTDEQFESVLAEAKGEGNLSRSNVVRKIKNLQSFSEVQAEKWQQISDLANDRLTSSQIAKRVGMTEEGLRAGARRKGIVFPADEVLGKTKRINGLDVLERIVSSIEADESVLGLIEFESITPEQAAELLQRLTSPLRAINRMKNRLKEISGE
ncbi:MULTISPECIES: hypothetical protein [unclassified Microbacterium]|uniref:hypothetical protein n=1 Tax=unclassified Microbacterium TaxID=2609290 RepID=UPI0024695269|nr:MULTISPECIES: hypothetical protein [unclassified Microbacterium]MDH5134987.1 hypothetical protein [Microbacterium sp. RD10]MDH5138558.1 hypothetical protein [Microbacterium sp. RD11]MDH5146934.1 hypothetical protein [Microbacterium sp. RD12]MDH5156624.1 hypothetical protein [Microbacterium sp. RD06]MDH5168088.1 hypothetical protein [Microbacterium sp. RD02]